VKSAFETENYSLAIKVRQKTALASPFLRFPGLLYELDLSPHESQLLSIKVEIDTNPPVGASVSTTIVSRYVTLNLLHHDRASLLAV